MNKSRMQMCIRDSLDIAATAKTPDGATGAMIRSIVELLKP